MMRTIGSDRSKLSRIAYTFCSDMGGDRKGNHMAKKLPGGIDPKTLIDVGLMKALELQRPVAAANVNRLRRVHADKSPKEIIEILNKTYVGAVSVTGAAAGATAIVPNGAVQIPAAIADFLAFTEATVLYVLSLAEVHGLDPEDIERRKLLVITVMLGDSAVGVLDKVIGRAGKHWAKQIVEKVPMQAVNAANKVLGPRFITKYGTKQGVLVLATEIPFGIGVIVGGGGNATFAWLTTRTAKKIFGAAPKAWPSLAPNGSDDGGDFAPVPATGMDQDRPAGPGIR